MKKILASLTAACMLVSMCALAACANGSEPETPSPEEPTTYTVTYAANEGVGTAPAAESYEEGKTFTVKENPFTREGYTFKGWNDGEKDVEAGSAYTMPAKDVTFSAQWEEITPQLCGIWSGSYELYGQTRLVEIMIVPGAEPYDYYIGGCGGGYGWEEMQGKPVDWSGLVESKTTPGLLEAKGLETSMRLQWSEEDKTLKCLYFVGEDTDKSFFMEYSPLPEMEPYTIEDGVYTFLKEESKNPSSRLPKEIVLQEGRATLQFGDDPSDDMQFDMMQIGNYTIMIMIVSGGNFNGYTMYPTDDGFILVGGLILYSITPNEEFILINSFGSLYYVRSEA